MEAEAATRGRCCSLLLGDLNWDDEVDGALPARSAGSRAGADVWADAWVEVHGSGGGETYDGPGNPMLTAAKAARYDIHGRLGCLCSRLFFALRPCLARLVLQQARPCTAA